MFIGIDAGGTKTDICICDKAGRIVSRSISAGINAARMGAEATAKALVSQLQAMGAICADCLYAGIAGAGNPAVSAQIKARLNELLPGIASITVTSDAFNALNAEVGTGDGIALIAGTGSSAFVRINGISRQVGGRGSLIDDAGSGYWTGRECLNAAYRALDGRGPQTALVHAAETLLGMPLADAVPRIYDGGAAYIAAFAPLVFEQAENGDAVAAAIAERCAAELLLHLKTCISGCKTPPRICVTSGGMFKAGYLRKALAGQVEALGLQLIYSDLPPVCGAVIAAAGEAADTEFVNTIKNAMRG